LFKTSVVQPNSSCRQIRHFCFDKVFAAVATIMRNRL